MKISQFFYSLQGEGKFSGVPAFFIRFPGCNLLCGSSEIDSGWKCDSLAQWSASEEWTIDLFWTRMVEGSGFAAEELIKKLEKGDIHIVFTGGEPLLPASRKYMEEIVKFLNTKAKRIFIELETNGTLELFMEDAYNIFGAMNPVYVNCSPKLKSSGVALEKRLNIDVLQSLVDNREINEVNFKFVVFTYEDVLEAVDLIKYVSQKSKESLESLISNTYLMPAGANREDIIKMSPLVWGWCAKHGFKFSSRLHIIAFDKKIDV